MRQQSSTSCGWARPSSTSFFACRSSGTISATESACRIGAIRRAGLWPQKSASSDAVRIASNPLSGVPSAVIVSSSARARSISRTAARVVTGAVIAGGQAAASGSHCATQSSRPDAAGPLIHQRRDSVSRAAQRATARPPLTHQAGAPRPRAQEIRAAEASASSQEVLPNPRMPADGEMRREKTLHGRIARNERFKHGRRDSIQDHVGRGTGRIQARSVTGKSL